MSRRPTEVGFGVDRLFTPLDGQVFVGEGEFQRAVIRVFNDRLSEFPSRYTYLDAITWAVRQGWILVDGARIAVALPAVSGAEAPPLALAA